MNLKKFLLSYIALASLVLAYLLYKAPYWNQWHLYAEQLNEKYFHLKIDKSKTDSKITSFDEIMLRYEAGGMSLPEFHKIIIHSDQVEFYAGNHQSQPFTKTVRSMRLSQQQISQLINAVNAADYFFLDTSDLGLTIIDRKNPAANGPIIACNTDASTITLSITAEGKTHKVNDYQGCHAPPELRTLEYKIEHIF